MRYNTELLQSIADSTNLHWAWEKAKVFYQSNEYWYDQLEFAEFTADYAKNIESIRSDILKGQYILKPLKPILFPKSSDETEPSSRQMFWVSIRDQVTWLAVMNVVGKHYDCQMPFWSYGNRLYISMFPKGSINGKTIWGFGPYRNTSRNTYRSFHQSWPRFRKDIYITAKLLCGRHKDLDSEELDDIKENYRIPQTHKILYKTSNYWKKDNCIYIYWCSIDFEKFYPNLKVEVIKNNFVKSRSFFPPSIIDFDRFISLIEALLSFKLNFNGFSENTLNKINLSKNNPVFNGIPTGLFAAGFLANVGLLEVDKTLQEEIEKKRLSNNKIAHFRYVDDQVILSNNFDTMLHWIDFIKSTVEKYMSFNGDCNLKINFKKTRPFELFNYFTNKYGSDNSHCEEINSSLGKYCTSLLKTFRKDDNLHKLCNKCRRSEDKLCKYIYENYGKNNFLLLEENNLLQKLKDKAKSACKLDPAFPSPLMNNTLKKMSLVNQIPIDLLDETELEHLINDLQHLLVTELPEDEIRADIRLSFASARLLKAIPAYFSFNILSAEEIDENQPSFFEMIPNSNFGNMEFNIRDEDPFRIPENSSEASKKRVLYIAIKENFRLFLICISKYPAKLSLWKNAILFCERTGHGEGLKDLLELVDILEKDKKINTPSKVYILSYLANFLVKSLQRCDQLIKEDSSCVERQIISEYLKGWTNVYIWEDGQKEASLISRLVHISNSKNILSNYYALQSFNLLKIFLGTFYYIHMDLKKNSNFEKTDILDWKHNPYEYTNEKGYDFNLIVWWLTNEFCRRTENMPPIFFKEYLKNMKIYNAAALSIFSLFPKYIGGSKLLKIMTNNFDPFFPFYWWDDLLRVKPTIKLKSSKRYFSSNSYQNYVLYRQERSKRGNKVKKKYIHIFDFILSANCTELMALKIVYDLLIRLGDEYLANSSDEEIDFELLSNISDNSINPNLQFAINTVDQFPYNLWINVNLLNVNVIQIPKKSFIEIHNYDNAIIQNQRYIPYFIDYEDSKHGLIFGIGVLLIQLLTHKVELPNFLYLPSNQTLETNLLLRTLETMAVSTFTLEIIRSCISKRARETIEIEEFKLLMRGTADMERLADFEIDEDKLVIRNPLDLKNAINVALSNILKNDYVFENKHRALIPINLKSLQKLDFAIWISENDN